MPTSRLLVIILFSMHFVCIENVVCTIMAFCAPLFPRLVHRRVPLALC